MKRKRTVWLLAAAAVLLALRSCRRGRPLPPSGPEDDPSLVLVTGYCNCGKCCGWERSWFGFGRPVYTYGPMKGSPKEIGATARGTLNEDDAIAEDGSFYDAYRISVKSGDKLRLTMVSNEFDAFIDIGREDEGGTFTSVVSDDDSLSDTHAKIDWAVEEDGDYIIRARSFASGQSGAYALTVEPKE